MHDIIYYAIKRDARDRPYDHPATCFFCKVPKSDRWCVNIGFASVGGRVLFFCIFDLILKRNRTHLEKLVLYLFYINGAVNRAPRINSDRCGT